MPESKLYEFLLGVDALYQAMQEENERVCREVRLLLAEHPNAGWLVGLRFGESILNTKAHFNVLGETRVFARDQETEKHPEHPTINRGLTWEDTRCKGLR